MRHLALRVAVALMLAAPALLYADGEPTAELSDSGIIVPIDQHYVKVLDQHVIVTLPPPKLVWERPAVIRAEYVLRNDGREPLRMMVGWPVGGRGYASRSLRPRPAAVKLDGKPVVAAFLSFDDLADPYVKEWLARIDTLLEAKPELREQVVAARQQEGSRQPPRPVRSPPSGLARWLLEHEPSLRDSVGTQVVAAGLVGASCSGTRRDQAVQEALRWLDPGYQYVHVYPILAERWDSEPRLLDPVIGQLADTRGGMIEDEPRFGIFRFPVALEPRREHRLVVQYGQFLGGAGLGTDPWYGLAYVMEPARRWGRWYGTTIEVHVPEQWQTVAIRPTAEKAGTSAGVVTYRIAMRRPCENLYVSVGRESPVTALWSRRVESFAGQWCSDQQRPAEEEFATYGRGPVTAAMRRLINEFPQDDARRTKAGFVLYVLDLDRALGRSVLIGVCRADRRPRPWEDALALVAMAYEHRPDGELLSAALDVVPRIDGASAEVMSHFVRDVAKERTRDLLTALWEKPNGLRQSVAGFLTGGLDDRPARQAYPEVARIADRAGDSLRRRADELLREVDRQQASIAQQRRRQEQRKDQQFPMVPKGVALPTSALKALQACYPHWHILATHGFDGRVVSSVYNRFGTAAGPQHVWGDFDGNGLRDVALLMRPNGPGEVKLIALRQWKADRWAADELSSFPFSSGFQGGYSGFTIYITPRAPGEVAYWTEQGKSGRLDLKHDGVERNFHGKASMLYYWTRSAWATVQTGD